MHLFSVFRTDSSVYSMQNFYFLKHYLSGNIYALTRIFAHMAAQTFIIIIIPDLPVAY